MKRKFIFLITLIFAGGVNSSLLNAQEDQEQEVIIGTSSYSSSYFPIRVNKNYSLSQQIYTSSDIGAIDENCRYIKSIAFEKYSTVAHTRNIKVYILSTEQTSLDGIIDFSDKDLYYSNESFSTQDDENYWVTVELDRHFYYSGDNIVICVCDNTGVSITKSPDSFMNSTATNKITLYTNKSSENDEYATPTYTNKRVNTKFTFTTDSGEGGEEIQTPPTAANTPKLNGLNPSEYAIYSNPTTLSWTWGENTTSYQVLVGTETTTENETTAVVNTLGQQEAQEFAADANSYTLNNLAPNTTYYWQVKSSNSNGDTYSEIWQFTTVNADPTEMVTKTAPADKASVKKSDLSFSWKNANTNHTRYTIYYKEDVATSEWAEFYSASSTDESYTPTESDFAKLEAGKTYLWKVNVNNAIYTSDDTDPWSFTVVPTGNLTCAVFNGDQAITATVELKEGEDVLSITTEGTKYFENITAGTYNLTIKANGFEEYIVKGVVIENGQTTNINIYMPTILDLDNGWINPNYEFTNGTLTENNEVIVRANAIMPQQAISINTLTIEEGKSLTISNGATLTVTGKINKENVADNLIIEDGGQIFQTNEGVQATFNMAIINPTDSEGNPQWTNGNKNGWQLISSPFTNAEISNFVTTGDDNDYDLYKFDGYNYLYELDENGDPIEDEITGAEEWVNFKNENSNFDEDGDSFIEFQQARGYLASYQSQEVASVSGILNTGTSLSLQSDRIKFTWNTVGGFENFHLIGNPFPFDMDMSKCADVQWNIVNGYATVNNGKYEYYSFASGGEIAIGDAFFIKVIGTSPNFYYNHNRDVTPSKSRSENHNSINLIATGAEGSDNLIISLSGAENEGFNKLENFNKDIATVFVVKNDIRYGIANFDNDVTMIDVAFEATKMGNYTIAAQPNGKFETLTLIDRFTGIETNLLVEDYSFTATSNDNYNRFIVKLNANGQQTTDNSHFAYVSGEDLIFNVEGSVQIIDMMGRVVYTSEIESANNRINVSDFNSAAYVVRVVNENGVKTQKLIVNSL